MSKSVGAMPGEREAVSILLDYNDPNLIRAMLEQGYEQLGFLPPKGQDIQYPSALETEALHHQRARIQTSDSGGLIYCMFGGIEVPQVSPTNAATLDALQAFTTAQRSTLVLAHTTVRNFDMRVVSYKPSSSSNTSCIQSGIEDNVHLHYIGIGTYHVDSVDKVARFLDMVRRNYEALREPLKKAAQELTAYAIPR